MTIAAYNAGPTPTARWQGQRPGFDPDLWIETISYKETREYVARVLAFSVIYDWRLNGDALPLSDRLMAAWWTSASASAARPTPSRAAIDRNTVLPAAGRPSRCPRPGRETMSLPAWIRLAAVSVVPAAGRQLRVTAVAGQRPALPVHLRRACDDSSHDYLVGGAVRDRLLQRPAGDHDWVVVGATPAQMEAQATPPSAAISRCSCIRRRVRNTLARTERKSGRGYRGFVVDADPAVTLEEDLQRRDFTINAIACDEDTGTLVDPYGGVRDLEQRVLRHVGPAFVEDPLRVLRAARFMARFAPLGFTVAEETMALMREVAASGELDALVPERVWQELRKALVSERPSAFLRTLHDAHALGPILPELEALYGVPQRAEFHPEVDTGIHQEMVSDMAAKLAPGDDLVGFAALTHDLGKGLTPPEEWPRHIMHEQRGIKPLKALCARLKIPAEHQQLAEAVCREHLNVHRIDELRDATVLELLGRCDALRRPERVARIALCCGGRQARPARLRGRRLPTGRNAQAPAPGGAVVQARDLDTTHLRAGHR